MAELVQVARRTHPGSREKVWEPEQRGGAGRGEKRRPEGYWD